MGSGPEGESGQAPRRLLPHSVKGFLQGGMAAVVGGVCTHPLDLVKVRMQLLGEGASAPSQPTQPSQPAARPAFDPLSQSRLASNPLGATPAAAGPARGALQTSLRGAAQGAGHIPGPVPASLPGALGALPGSVGGVPGAMGVGGSALRGHFSLSAAGAAGAAGAAPHAAEAALARPSAVAVAAQILRTQGVPGLFEGVSATALRQALYSSSRFGVYEILKGRLEEQQRRAHLESGSAGEGLVAIPIQKKVAAALFSGAVGAAIGNPADLAMVRMQADGRLPLEARRNYRSVGDAISRIVREEGALSLWKGCGPTVYRAMAVTAGQLATYDQAKEFIVQRHLAPDGVGAHVASSLTAAVVASVASNPFDVLKTRLMNMKPDPVTGEAPYKGALDCAVKTVTAEGPLALYKGLVPTIARQGPFTLILFVTLEQLRKLFANL